MSGEVTEEQPVELTEREIAIAEGQSEDVINEASDLLPPRSDERKDDNTEAYAETDDAVDDTDAETVAEADDVETDDEPEGDEDADGDDDEPQATFTDDDYALGESYGLSREEVDELGSKETLEKVGRAVSRNFLAKPPAKSDETTAQPKNDAKPDPPSEEEGKETPSLEGLDLSKIDLDGYDDVTKQAFKAIDSLQSTVAELKSEREAMKAQASQQEERQQTELFEKFNRALDTLDQDFYGQQYKTESGGPVRISANAEQRRVELAEAVDTLIAGYESTGRTPPSLDNLIKDAHAITFRDRVAEVAKKSTKGRLKKQAARRQAAGNRVTAKPKREPVDDEEADIMRILEETEADYHAMLEENGRE